MSISDKSQIFQTTRSALDLMVKYEEREAGREVAYSTVARRIKRSSSWVKKFVLGDATVGEPRMSVFLEVRAAYEDLCQRVEQEHQKEIAKIAIIRGNIHAATEGWDKVVGCPDIPGAPGETHLTPAGA